MKSYYSLFAFVFLFSACTSRDDELAHIITQESQRVSCDSLLTYFESTEPIIRARAVEAVGKLQDSTCIEAVAGMLDDPNHNVRMEAVFALGQMGSASAEEALIERFHAKEINDIKVRIIEALGKIGTKKSFPLLLTLFTSDKANLRAEAALSTARMAMRKLNNSSLTKALAILLHDDDEEVRWKAAYALMRIGDNLEVKSLRNALNDGDPRVRMYAIQALGKLQDLGCLETFGRILTHDPDWRVRVKVANTLGSYPLRRVANYYSLLNQETHVRHAILQAVGLSAQKEPKRFQQNSREHNLARFLLEQVLNEQTNHHDQDSVSDYTLWHPSEIGAALISYAQLMQSRGIDLIARFAEHNETSVRARAMSALGETQSSQAFRVFETHYASAPAMVKIAILQALPKIPATASDKIYLQALNENDQVLLALAAEAISQDTVKSQMHVQNIIQAYEKLPPPVDAESVQMIFQALEKIGDSKAIPVLEKALKFPDKAISKAAAAALETLTGKSYNHKITPVTRLREQINYRDLAKLNDARAFIKTSRGSIEIKLYTSDAPLTVLNFVQLAEKGFFDRLTFHRVVPNFVIQGGDPRGDSWGSPGYAIRSEFNKRNYLRGTVGMASAGKDTEGCQFFITHSEQPHLDGRYTVFGQVTSGMDVVDAIQEGDVMELVSIRK